MDVRKRLIKIAQRRKVIRKLWLKKENKLKIGSSIPGYLHSIFWKE